ncbi:MAG: hypothetical protein ACM3JB_06740 [Acidobacteriaceae bacterium]
MTDPSAFDVWKERLREDCARQDKLLAFNALGDFVLRVLWERGIAPNVEDIVSDAKDLTAPSQSFPEA